MALLEALGPVVDLGRVVQDWLAARPSWVSNTGPSYSSSSKQEIKYAEAVEEARGQRLR